MTEAHGPPRIAFRCDASDQIGGGHVMRCLTLANALSDAGAKVIFVAAETPDVLASRIEDAGHQLVRIAAAPELERPGGKWEEPPLSEDAQLADAGATGAIVGQADWIVVDHYLLDSSWHSAARKFAERILVIDDLANRSYDCDILLDQTLGRAPEDYRDLTPSYAKILAGPTYALLRPEFARERPAALERRKSAGPAHRILVSMGTMDPEGITARIVREVLAVAPECAIDVVLGPQAASLTYVRDIAASHPNVALHVNTNRMAELMRDADLAIGAAGTTSWERCCLGLPSIALVLAENQSLIADSLAGAGAHIAVTVGSAQSLTERARSLLASSENRTRMAESAAGVTDGLGLKRVRAVMDSMNARENLHG
jgi:UDP-2,4-diacetamido-2,4,6-trideoxy-beta-L-altropyranose hydrolase